MRIKHISSVVLFTILLMLPLLSFSETINYTYDSLNRLVREERPGRKVVTYTYDSRGNRTSKVINVKDTNCDGIPDTGQTKCYDNSQEIPCPQPGEPFYGQDAQYSPNPQSYTDLENGIIKDNVTGLEWQQATVPGTYTWQQANMYCENLTLGGHSDWRLPTIKELSFLMDSSRPYPGPTINTSYFPDTVAEIYWSSTTNANFSDNAWGVLFYNGSVGYIGKSSSFYVRAVRGEQSYNYFIDNGDGTVTDTSTGLMWQQATAPGTYTWEQALSYCENLTLPAGGYSDWRLPNRNELQSIVDYNGSYPAIDTTYFPDTVMSNYWSSTTDAGDTHLAWSVGFDNFNSFIFSNAKSLGYYVRAVRGGQCTSTVIKLSSFTASPKTGRVILKWTTESEIDNAGFNLYRAESQKGEYNKINKTFIPAEGNAGGASYKYEDKDVRNGKTYYYKLEDVDLNGKPTFHGPVSATPRLIYGLSK